MKHRKLLKELLEQPIRLIYCDRSCTLGCCTKKHDRYGDCIGSRNRYVVGCEGGRGLIGCEYHCHKWMLDAQYKTKEFCDGWHIFKMPPSEVRKRRQFRDANGRFLRSW